ncbi:uncharacterized protein EI97DRAFT_261914 [Westerdykella ornata]|uniref:Uncharacterized protein n=1 Tax=Westerdykella ornata TaxID=318751 RepID=A0A6A6J6T5_WESOR|nr:uncharacterized protein EI97DRAFT_261914 [Westerdykella ornata]KAF2271688.1 hypothetical protein EI97DRAFT_261914 [Westerdykella ornata]
MTYLLASCAPVQRQIAGAVDGPNACTTMEFLTEVFDFNISPHGLAENRYLRTCAIVSSQGDINWKTRGSAVNSSYTPYGNCAKMCLPTLTTIGASVREKLRYSGN